MEKKTDFNVIIAGSRTYQDYDLLKRTCDALLRDKCQTHHVVVFSGTATGADRLGERYASETGLDIRYFAADWMTYGRSAGMRRNAQMANEAHALIAFWDGQSRGTAHMIEMARKKNLIVHVKQYIPTIQSIDNGEVIE